jgi:site-specific DNA-adenine methylase
MVPALRRPDRRSEVRRLVKVDCAGCSYTAWERPQIAAANLVLRSCDVTLVQQDFAAAMAHARAGDVCFIDPTYTAIRPGPFDRYNANLFTWDDQIRLHSVVEAAADRGAVVIICMLIVSRCEHCTPGA